jgi:ABC-2 type transport system ATP-binding protein
MADRIGVINKGRLILVEEKSILMQKMGKRQMTLELQEPMQILPQELAAWRLTLQAKGLRLQYDFDANDQSSDIPGLLQRMAELKIGFKDLATRQSSLEEIFVHLVSDDTSATRAGGAA